MSFLSSVKKRISQNVNSFLRENLGDADIKRRDFEKLLLDQFGHDWKDRLNIVNSKITPERLDTILKQASPRVAGKLGQLYELMYKVRQDARVRGMIDKRAEAVTRSIVDFKSGNPDNTEANEAAEELEKWYNSIKMKGLLQAQMDGKFYGVTAFQNVIYKDGSGFYYIEDPTKHQISQTRWGMGTGSDEKGFNRWGRLFIKRSNAKSFSDRSSNIYIDDPADINPYKLSSFIYQDKRGYYDTTGILYPVTNLYLIKVYAITFWMQYAERHGRPFVYANLSQSNFKDEKFKTTIRLLLQNLGKQRWGIFPDGMKVDHLDASSTATSDILKSLIDFANIEMAIAVLGQNLSTEVQGGSYAAASSHADVEHKKTEGDVEWLQEGNNENYSYLLTKLNHPNLDPDDYPELVLTPKRDVDLQQIGRGFTELAKVIDVPVSEIYEAAQMRQPEKNPEFVAGEDNDEPKYLEPVVGPSTSRSSLLQRIAEGG